MQWESRKENLLTNHMINTQVHFSSISQFHIVEFGPSLIFEVNFVFCYNLVTRFSVITLSGSPRTGDQTTGTCAFENKVDNQASFGGSEKLIIVFGNFKSWRD